MARDRKAVWLALSHVAELKEQRNVLGLIAELENPLESGRLSIVRADAAIALGELGDLRAAPHLVALAGDRSEMVRMYAVEALAQIDGSGAQEVFLDGLRDTSRLVRLTAVDAVRKSGVANAGDLLRDLARRDDDQWVRLYAYQALAATGEPASSEEIAAWMRSVPWWMKRRRAWRQRMDDLLRSMHAIT